MSVLKKLIKIILLISVILFLASYFKKNDLPQREQILSSLYQEPSQTEIEIKPFQIEKEGFTYNVTPKYSYELYGLVVSYYDSENWLDIFHKEDPLNTRDVCVIWGDNVKTDVYQNMKFKSGEFTCYWKFKQKADSSWYSKFNDSQGSNSHFLPKDDEIYKKMKEVTIGDQIYFKGYLVDYSVESSDGGVRTRNTSITRTDVGNGACEVVYVTDFQILEKGNSVYSLINRVSKYLIIVCLILLLILIFFPSYKKIENKVSSIL